MQLLHKYILLIFFILYNAIDLQAQQVRTEPTVRKYLTASRILWQQGLVKNADKLLLQGNGQADLSGKELCVLQNVDSTNAAILLDFGKELQGGIQLVTDQSNGGKPVKVRLRFGESASEAMSMVEPIKNATNDHAMRDYTIQLPWLGKIEVGNTGFRFVRIDLTESQSELKLKEVSAILVYRDIPYLGSFHSSDSLLNQIWQTGAYTVHLNMQDYLWDGIKRDRLVWVGDMHPETSTIAAVFGDNEVIRKSLDLSRNITPLPGYMNGMISYSMWWILMQHDYYMHTGNLAYLKEQHVYLAGLLNQLLKKIDPSGSEVLDGGGRFLDWPSSNDNKAIHAGLQALLFMSLGAGAELCHTLRDQLTEQACLSGMSLLKKHIPDGGNSKQAAALLSLSGLVTPEKANAIISKDGVKNYSTYFGFYMLQAKAKAAEYQGGIDAIRTYWGAMLGLGATTFWEDFNMDWLPNASRVDELVPAGKKDIHGDYGDYCYKGFRHSFSHGWASGPTSWLTEYVLGVRVVAPGCKVVKIEPHLGDLSFVEGTYPTPYGVISIKHSKGKNGKIITVVKAPKGIKII